MGASGSDWWPGLPAPPTEAQARAALAGWAHRQRLVPDALFDGRLEPSDASVVRLEVDRLLETRTETAATVPRALGQLPTYENLLTHRLDGDEWQERDWHGARRGSVMERDCPACVGRGRLTCATCQGQGSIRCQRKVACPRCRGTGWVDIDRGPPVTCAACRGSKLQWCPRCGGIGQRACTNTSCTGGSVLCAACGHSGRLTSYQAGRIRRWVEHRTVEAGAGLVALEAADRAESRLLLVADQAPDLSALPAHLLAELSTELGRKPPEELRRRVRVWVLPVARVRYLDGGSRRTAYLIGPERRVHAPEARRLRWPFRRPG